MEKMTRKLVQALARLFENTTIKMATITLIMAGFFACEQKAENKDVELTNEQPDKIVENVPELTGEESDTVNLPEEIPDLPKEIPDLPDLCDPTTNPDFMMEENSDAKNMIVGKWAQIGNGDRDDDIKWYEPLARYIEFLPDGRYNPSMESYITRYIIGDTCLNKYINTCESGYHLYKYSFINQDTLKLKVYKGAVEAIPGILIHVYKRINN